MNRIIVLRLITIGTLLIELCSCSVLFARAPDRNWIARSNQFTQMYLDVVLRRNPEDASSEGLKQYDTEITRPTRENDEAEIADTRQVQEKFRNELAHEQDKSVAQDLQILIRRLDITLKTYDLSKKKQVPFLDAGKFIFTATRTLLDDQVESSRHSAAVVRLRKYAGLESGYVPFVEIYKKRTEEQMAKPGTVYPSKVQLETELSRSGNYIEGIEALCKKYKLQGWQEAHAKLKTQLNEYNDWLKKSVLPKARTDFRLTPEEYELAFEQFGLDIAPERIAALAHEAFNQIQAQMKPIAAQVAKQKNLPSSEYRDVIRSLKKEQITSENVLPFYKKRLHDIEVIIEKQSLVALPARPARIRLATPAESTEQPAPHMNAPPLVHNTGEQGEFVLPLNMPAGPNSNETQKADDSTFDAAAWTLTAHEARPGHELQFDSMIEHGVSLARALFAFNSTNVEGWGLYAEYITLPYMPPEGQLISLQFRLLRAARAFLDPELQTGKIQPADAMRVLTEECVLSTPFANQEVERYTFRIPGQANSYFYGYTRLLSLRKEVEESLGPKFNAYRFHNFLLAQGLLPPDLLRKAVMDDFIPRERTQ